MMPGKNHAPDGTIVCGIANGTESCYRWFSVSGSVTVTVSIRNDAGRIEAHGDNEAQCVEFQGADCWHEIRIICMPDERVYPLSISYKGNEKRHENGRTLKACAALHNEWLWQAHNTVWHACSQ